MAEELAPLNIKDERNLEVWLQAQPPEVAVIFAARAALRVLPLHWRLANFAGSPQKFANWTVPLFRAVALARAASRYPTRASEIVVAAKAACTDIMAVINAVPESNSNAGAAARVALNAASVACNPTPDFARIATASVLMAAWAQNAAADDLWAAVAADVNFLSVPGNDAALLAVSSLWRERRVRRTGRDSFGSSGTLEREPEWASSAWRELVAALPKDQDWDVWTDWYEDRLKGAADPEEIELIYVTVPLEKWDEGPAAANAWIRTELERLYSPVTAQLSAAEEPDQANSEVLVEWDFFLSYSPKDEAFARFVDDVLRQAGYSVFARFRESPTAPISWRQNDRGFDHSARVIALLSPNYLGSPGCAAEFHLAHDDDPSDDKRKLVPLLIAPTDLEPLARQIVFESLVGLSTQKAADAILSAIGHRARVTPRARWPGADPRVPVAIPAAIEPIVVNGRIALPQNAATAELDKETLDAALHALRAQIFALAGDLDGEANIDKRAIRVLRELAEKIPLQTPTQAQLFELAHEQETLEAYGKTVAAEWPELLAGRYLATTRAFERTVRQFPKWRLFKKNADKNRLTDEQRDEALKLAADFAAALHEAEASEFVAPEIADAFAHMCRDLDAARDAARGDHIALSASTLAEDVVASSENVLKLMAEAALQGVDVTAKTAKEAASGYAKEFGKGAIEQAKKEGKKDGAALVKWVKGTLIVAGLGLGAKTVGLGAVIAQMIETHPQIAEWLRPIIEHLSHLPQ